MQLMEESDDNMIVWHVLPGERGAPESITYLVRLLAVGFGSSSKVKGLPVRYQLLCLPVR